MKKNRRRVFSRYRKTTGRKGEACRPQAINSSSAATRGTMVPFKTIGDKFGPFDLALLECGQYNEKWPDIHMQPENTVQAGVDLKTKVLMPVHWGKFKLALHPWREPINRSTHRAHELGVSVTTQGSAKS